MGRLFWKLFLFIWLGQMAAVFGTGALFWAERHGLVAQMQDRGPPPPPRDFDEHRLHPLSGDLADYPPPERRPPPRPLDLPGLHVPIWPVLIGFVASLLCAAGLAWYFAKPIRHLRQGLSAMAEGKLSVRVSPGMGRRRDELADLGRDFDHMAEGMQTLIDRQKRLLHDVSHELRSPLARLQAAVGLARQQPDRWGDTLMRIERESERMDQLIGELLTLSRLEAGVVGHVGPVAMEDLLHELVEDARFEGMGAQVGIDFRPERMATVMADGEMLHRAIENVVRNALRFSPPGSNVRIEAGLVESGMFQVCVMDQGPGVGEAELESIFLPFYRGVEQAGGRDGYGLGLAIARQIVQRARGVISACNSEHGGLRVCIEIPVVG